MIDEGANQWREALGEPCSSRVRDLGVRREFSPKKENEHDGAESNQDEFIGVISVGIEENFCHVVWRIGSGHPCVTLTAS